MPLLTTRVDQNGRIVLPAEVRRRLGVGPGDQVVLDVGERDVRLSSHWTALESLRQMVRERPRDASYSVDGFIVQRRAERAKGARIRQRRAKRRG
jgi:AbrB family looped-hinge helix DNA binding protein